MSPAVLTLGSGETAQATLLAEASDGAPVEWLVSNGTLTDQTDVQDGRATATLTADGGTPGRVIVLATVGFEQTRWEGEIVTGGELGLAIEPPLLMADVGATGLLSTRSNEPWDGRRTTLELRGPPGAVALVRAGGSELVEAYTFEAESGSTVPGVVAGRPMSLHGAVVRSEESWQGSGSLRIEPGSTATIEDAPAFDFPDRFLVELWLRPESLAAGRLLAKGEAWGLELLADGRITGWITTAGGRIDLVSTTAVEVSAWNRLALAVSSESAHLSLNAGTTIAPVSGSIATNDQPLVLGGSVDVFVDEVAFYSAPGGLSLLALTGADAAGQVVLDASGEAALTVSSLGVGGLEYEDVARVEILGALLPTSSPIDGSSSTLQSLLAERGTRDLAFVKDVVVITTEGAWEDGRRVIFAFWGADTEGGTEFVASIVGGFLGTADVGALFKNLWRMAGLSEAEVNRLEVAFSLLGIATTVAPHLDAAVSAVRTIVARIGSSPLAEALFRRMVELVVEGGSLRPGELGTYQRLASSGDAASDIKRLIDSESLADFSEMENFLLRSCGRAGSLSTKAEGEDADVLVTKFEGCWIAAIREAFKQVPEEELKPLLDELAKAENREAWEQIAKSGSEAGRLLLNMAKVSTKVSPFYAVKIAKNCSNVCLDGLPPGGYPVTKLFDDLVGVSEVDGFERLAKRVAIRNKQAAGFRYELEVANTCKGIPGQVLAFVDFGIEVILDETGKAWTDVDVVCEIDGKKVLYQAKRSANAFKSVKGSKTAKVEEWLAKAKKWLELHGEAGEIRYAVPSFDLVPPEVKRLLAIQEPDAIIIEPIPSIPAPFDGP